MSSVTVSDLFTLLSGDWRLSRRIEDARAGAAHMMEGRASFRPDALGRLLYSEAGVLRLGAQEMRAERQMIWEFPGDHALIRFADGRVFHELRLEAGEGSARHECGDDLYLGAYDLRDPKAWRVEWRVSGPRKSYRSLTIYSL